MNAKVSVKSLVVAGLMAVAAAPAMSNGNPSQGVDGSIDCSSFSASYGTQTFNFIEAASGGTCVGLKGGNDSASDIPASWNLGSVTLYRDNTVGSSESTSPAIDVQWNQADGKAFFNFNSNFLGDTVLGLKFGTGGKDATTSTNDWGLFFFDEAKFLAGTTLTFSWLPAIWSGTNGAGLSHGSVYGNATTPPIPEPETYALMLAGLGAVTFVARRRKLSGR